MAEVEIDGRRVVDVVAWAADPADMGWVTEGERVWVRAGAELSAALAGGWRRVGWDPGSGQVLVWRPVPAVPAPAAAGPPPGPPGEPDLNRLWQVWQRVRGAQLDALVAEGDAGLVWRFARSDWGWLLRDGRAEVGRSITGGPGAWRFLGLPVVEVPDAAGAWPELVLVVDRRV